MAESSWPWPGVAGAAYGVDAGRYNAPEWWAAWSALSRAGGMITAGGIRTAAAFTYKGVFYSIGNHLEVADAGGLDVTVDTGGSLVEGQAHYNDASVTLTLPASQTDYYVVVRKNYTAATYTPPGYVAGSGRVGPYTSRITWVSALVQDTARATYWDIPLAKFTTDAGDITALTDERDYVDAETKTILVSPYTSKSYDSVGGDRYPLEPEETYSRGLIMVDDEIGYAYLSWIVPIDFISDLVIEPVFNCETGTGDPYVCLEGSWGACGEDYDTNTLDAGCAAVDVTSSYLECSTISMDTSAPDIGNAPEVGEVVMARFIRDAENVLDTNADDCYFLGFRLTYFGWK